MTNLREKWEELEDSMRRSHRLRAELLDAFTTSKDIDEMQRIINKMKGLGSESGTV